MRYTIPLSYNSIDIAKLTEVLSRYEGVHHNQIVTDFEEELKKIIDAPFVVALNSGTSAIHLALKVLDIGQDDLVIVPTFTYIATVNPILYLGAKPIFIDSEPETWNMDPDLLEKALEDLKSKGKKAKAIMIVHTYGMPSKMDRIVQLAESYSIPLIEDAAESLGASWFSKKVGSIGQIGIFSFNNNKMMTTYGGGILVTKDRKIASRVRFLASQSRENLPYYEHVEVGYNYALSPILAAYGIGQLGSFDKSIDCRRDIFETYRSELEPFGVDFLPEPAGFYSIRWLSTAIFKNKATRLQVSSVLTAKGIETRPLWKPMHLQPLYYNKTLKYVSGVAENLFDNGLCLPSGHKTSRDEIQLIITTVKEVINKVTM